MKSYIIYNPHDSLSRELAESSVRSCNAHGLQPELFEGYFEERIDEKLKLHHLSHSNMLPKEIRKGEQGCFLSHFELWNRCVKDNEPLLILEHDVFMKSTLPEGILDRFDDVLHLDYCISLRKDLEKYKECAKEVGSNFRVEQIFKEALNKEVTWKSAKAFHVSGAHAYIIKPSAAKKLIDKAHSNGFFPADVHINCHYVDIYVVKPTVFRLCDFMADKKNIVKFSSTKGYKTYAAQQ